MAAQKEMRTARARRMTQLEVCVCLCVCDRETARVRERGESGGDRMYGCTHTRWVCIVCACVRVCVCACVRVCV